jgi:hypothetical protein
MSFPSSERGFDSRRPLHDKAPGQRPGAYLLPRPLQAPRTTCAPLEESKRLASRPAGGISLPRSIWPRTRNGLFTLPQLEKASRTLAKASKVFIEKLELVEETGCDVDLPALWRALEEVAPRAAISGAAATVVSLVPEDDHSAEIATRGALALRFNTAKPFLALWVHQDPGQGHDPRPRPALPLSVIRTALPGVGCRQRGYGTEIISIVTPGSLSKFAFVSVVITVRFVATAVAAMIRSCAPRGLPDLRVYASSRACTRATSSV